MRTETTAIFTNEGVLNADVSTLQRFMTADTLSKLRQFCEKYSDLFDRSFDEGNLPFIGEDFLDSAEDARRILNDTLEMLRRSRADDDDVPEPEELESLGLYVSDDISDEYKKFLHSKDALVKASHEDFEFTDDAQARRHVRETGYHGLEETDDIIGVRLLIDIEGVRYAAMLDRLVASYKAQADARGIAARVNGDFFDFDDENKDEVHPAEGDTFDVYRLFGFMGFYPNTKEGLRLALQTAADALFTLHLIDAQTISIDGGHEVRSIATGLGSLWWCAIEALKKGRIGSCEVCGAPYITNNERGKRRKFCSEACKQWNKKYPGLKRRPGETHSQLMNEESDAPQLRDPNSDPNDASASIG